MAEIKLLDKYTTAPNVRESVNSIVTGDNVADIKAGTFTAITDNSGGSAANGLKQIDLLSIGFVHVSGQSDIALQTSFVTVTGTVDAAIDALAASVNQALTIIGAELITSVGAVTTVGTIPAVTVEVTGSQATAADGTSRAHANAALEVLRNNLSTVILAFNRLADRTGQKRITDVGLATASSDLILAAIPAAPAAIGNTGDVASKAAVDATLVLLRDNIAFVASKIAALRTAVMA